MNFSYCLPIDQKASVIESKSLIGPCSFTNNSVRYDWMDDYCATGYIVLLLVPLITFIVFFACGINIHPSLSFFNFSKVCFNQTYRKMIFFSFIYLPFFIGLKIDRNFHFIKVYENANCIIKKISTKIDSSIE